MILAKTYITDLFYLFVLLGEKKYWKSRKQESVSYGPQAKPGHELRMAFAFSYDREKQRNAIS